MHTTVTYLKLLNFHKTNTVERSAGKKARSYSVRKTTVTEIQHCVNIGVQVLGFVSFTKSFVKATNGRHSVRQQRFAKFATMPLRIVRE